MARLKESASHYGARINALTNVSIIAQLSPFQDSQGFTSPSITGHTTGVGFCGLLEHSMEIVGRAFSQSLSSSSCLLCLPEQELVSCS